MGKKLQLLYRGFVTETANQLKLKKLLAWDLRKLTNDSKLYSQNGLLNDVNKIGTAGLTTN